MWKKDQHMLAKLEHHTHTSHTSAVEQRQQNLWNHQQDCQQPPNKSQTQIVKPSTPTVQTNSPSSPQHPDIFQSISMVSQAVTHKLNLEALWERSTRPSRCTLGVPEHVTSLLQVGQIDKWKMKQLFHGLHKISKTFSSLKQIIWNSHSVNKTVAFTKKVLFKNTQCAISIPVPKNYL